jgi:tRNA(adenine34) deaminase
MDRSGEPLSPPVLSEPRPGDRAWMARALEMARLGGLRDEVPVGAVLVQGHRLLAEGYNRTIAAVDPTAHAEVVAIREGARRLGDWRLTEATLYVTLEPCALCAGAIVLARIPRVVFGAPDLRFGMAVTLGNLLQDPRLNHRVELVGGVLAQSSSDLLRGFFRERRGGA